MSKLQEHLLANLTRNQYPLSFSLLSSGTTSPFITPKPALLHLATSDTNLEIGSTRGTVRAHDKISLKNS